MQVYGRQLKIIDLSYLLVSLLVFVYVLVRALKVDITYDEVWTIFDFIPNSYYYILNFTPPDTNNHILNSIAIKLLYSFLPDTVFVARIPNVIALLFYLVFGNKLCKHFFGDWIGFILFLALTLNPFALDFFGLARGYGLVLGMQMGALYHLLRYFEEKKHSSLVYISLFSFLMILSNFSTLYFYLGWLGVFFISLLIDRQKIVPRSGIVLVFTVLIAAVVWEPIRKLIEIKGFYVGGTTGFYQDTIWSLTRYSMYSMEKSDWNQLVCGSLFVAVLICVVMAFFAEGKKTNFFITLGILLITALATIVQHYLLDGLYLVDRTALFFYPIMILLLFFAIRTFDSQKLSLSLSVVMGILIVINFLRNANTYKSLLWYFDSHSSEIYSYINKEGEKQKRKQKVDYCWPFESNLAFHIKNGEYPYLSNARKSYFEVNDSCDFYLYLGGKLDVIPYNPSKQLILSDSRKRDTVFSFPEEEVYVFKINAK